MSSDEDPEMFPEEDWLNTAALPPEEQATFDRMRLKASTQRVVQSLYAYCCQLEPSERHLRWVSLRRFMIEICSPAGQSILLAFVDGVLVALDNGKVPPFGSDRFARKVAFDGDIEVANDSLPWYLAAVGVAHPDLLRFITVDTVVSRMLLSSSWEPAAPVES